MVGFLAAAGVCLFAQMAAPERVNLAVFGRIRNEAFAGRSKVMDTAFYLTDVYGPRLTGSPAAKQAGDWALQAMKDWGLANVQMEPWKFAGAGWSCSRFLAQMKEPEFQPIIGFAAPWSLGTNGDVTGQAMMATITTAEEMEQYKGKLKGKFLLTAAPHPSEMVTQPFAHRLTDAELAAAGMYPDPIGGRRPRLAAVRPAAERPRVARRLLLDAAALVISARS
jgi:hypothetical protein